MEVHSLSFVVCKPNLILCLQCLIIAIIVSFYRVQCYIKFGWDQNLVDPDKGANSHEKLAAVTNSLSLPSKLLHSVPAEDDPEWTSRLYKIPDINFSSIYEFLVDWKVLLKRVSYLECVADKQAEAVTGEGSDIKQNDRVAC